MNAEDFILSLRKFIARRGCPNLIVSDNGSAFISELTQNFASENCIQWQFNPAQAPWWGGHFERLVGCVKRCLRKSIGKVLVRLL